jgi:Arc/MetJ family transcription regulator
MQGLHATRLALEKPLSSVYSIYISYTRDEDMRTNIVIDDGLMQDALRLTGLKTKKEAVELGLKTLIRLKKQESIKRFRGRLTWEGDLDELRTAR